MKRHTARAAGTTAGDGAHGHAAKRGVGSPSARMPAHASSSTSMGRTIVASTSSEPRVTCPAASYVELSKVGQFVARPLHDRVLVQPLDGEEKTAGGIIIPDTAKEKPSEGKIIAVGPGAKTEDGKILPMEVKVGDLVLFGKWSGTEVKIDGVEYSIMKESDIMGIMSKKK